MWYTPILVVVIIVSCIALFVWHIKSSVTKEIKEEREDVLSNPQYQKYLRLIKPDVKIEYMGIFGTTVGNYDDWYYDDFGSPHITFCYVDMIGVLHTECIGSSRLDLIKER